MTTKKINKLMNSMITEAMNENTHFLLTEYYDIETDNTYGEWGWNNKIENIKQFVLYVAIVRTIAMHNNNKPGVISDEILDKLFNEKQLSPNEINSLNKKEKIFHHLFNALKDAKCYDEIVQSINTMIEFLNDNDYEINVCVYKDAYEALPKALELDKYLPEGEVGFGEFLRSCLEN